MKIKHSVSLRKAKGKYYARIRWRDARNLQKEITLSLRTDLLKDARARLKKVKNEAQDIVDGITKPFEFKTLFRWLNPERISRHTSLKLKHIIPEYLKFRKCVVSEGSYERDGYSLKQLTNVLGDNKVIQDITYKDIEQVF